MALRPLSDLSLSLLCWAPQNPPWLSSFQGILGYGSCFPLSRNVLNFLIYLSGSTSKIGPSGQVKWETCYIHLLSFKWGLGGRKCKYYMSELSFSQSAMVQSIAPHLSKGPDSAPNSRFALLCSVLLSPKPMVAIGSPVY